MSTHLKEHVDDASLTGASENLNRSSARVVIVGGGIAGLSAAWYVHRKASAEGISAAITLLEASDRWGGKIRTEAIAEPGSSEPFIVEAGPDSFLTQKPWALQLARELGLSERLLGTNDPMRRVFVLNHGQSTPLPDGVLMIVPTKLRPFALSSLISPLGKLRMGMDLLIPPKRDGEDETIADFIRRRLGAEALDKIAEPMMSGIYNAEAEKQSLLATFPRFRAIEEEYGSLIRGMVQSRKKHPAPQATVRQTTMFTSLRDGMQELVEALVAQLTCDLRLNASVETIERSSNGSYDLHLKGGMTIDADTIILAVPSYIAASLLRDVAPESASRLDEIRYVSTGTISLGFHRAEISHPLNGFGLVIPRSENRPINAITWTSTKFDHRAPQDAVLLRVFFGGSRHPEMMDIGDAELLSIVRAELASLMRITAAPIFHRIYRWHRANPQYDVGHLGRVDAIEASLPNGLYVTGSPYRGIGIPDCVYQSQQTADRVIEQLRERT